jgi:hypothetical protein
MESNQILETKIEQVKDDSSSSQINKMASVMLGLAVGDSLGATSEFQIPWYQLDNFLKNELI